MPRALRVRSYAKINLGLEVLGLRDDGYLDPAAVRRAWEQHLAGWWDRRFLLWNILTFQAWLDETG